MGLPEFTDPYIDPESGVLRNLVDARTQAALDAAEADLVHARTIELAKGRLERSGDLTELRAIHRHLFQDIYEWAGEIRTVDLSKNVDGAEHFLHVSRIEPAAVFAAADLTDDDQLRGLDRRRFVERLAHHYDQFNYIHPFREGNGRTQRVFWGRVARDAGWQIEWPRVTGASNDQASRVAAEQGDLTLLIEMFDRIVDLA